ncbi:MAG: hypothetical protein ACFFDN_13635 [Candidatus Hodarchaeota archaeon]
MKTKNYLWILLIFIMLTGCGGDTQIKDDKAPIIIGKIIARRLGVAAVQKYPILVSQIKPVTTAIIESAAKGDDLILTLKKGIAEIPLLDAWTKKDIQDLIEILEVNNIDPVYQEIATGFLEGVSIYSKEIELR